MNSLLTSSGCLVEGRQLSRCGSLFTGFRQNFGFRDTLGWTGVQIALSFSVLVGCRLVEASLSCFEGLIIGASSDLTEQDTSRMAAPASAYKDRQFLAVIGDEVSAPGCD